MATIDVKDADDARVPLEKPLAPGRAAAAASRPVALSTEDLAALQTITSYFSGFAPVVLMVNAAATGAAQAWPGGEAYLDLEGVTNGATFTIERQSPQGTWVAMADSIAVDQTYHGPIGPIPAGNVRGAISGAGGSTSLTAYLSGYR